MKNQSLIILRQFVGYVKYIVVEIVADSTVTKGYITYCPWAAGWVLYCLSTVLTVCELSVGGVLCLVLSVHCTYCPWAVCRWSAQCCIICQLYLDGRPTVCELSVGWVLYYLSTVLTVCELSVGWVLSVVLSVHCRPLTVCELSVDGVFSVVISAHCTHCQWAVGWVL